MGTLVSLAVIAVVAIILERIITRYLRRFARRTRLEPHVANNLILTFRLLILIGAAALMVRAGGLPTEWLVAVSALGGAAVGFASTKTIGNFIAGLYLLATRPFKVGDYVRLGIVEGVVQEVTINYTKILTVGNNAVSVSSLQVMDRDITNYLYEEAKQPLCCYTFEIGFDRSVSANKIEEIFNEVFKQYIRMLPKKPNYMLTRSGAFERVYTVYLYVDDPASIFTFRTKMAEDLFKLWDKERAKTKP